MKQYFKFEDAEKEAVSAIKKTLEVYGDTNFTYRVGTKRVYNDGVLPAQAKQVEFIVRVFSGPVVEVGLREEQLNIYVFVSSNINSVTNNTENKAYALANTASNLLASLLPLIPNNSKFLRNVDYGQISPFEDEGAYQVRMITTECLNRGTLVLI